MKMRHMLMSVGLAGAAGLAFFGDKSADIEIAEPVASRSAMPHQNSTDPSAVGKGVTRSSTRIEAESQVIQREAEVRILSLQPRASLMNVVGSVPGAGLFSSKSWAPLPVVAKLAPPPPPSAPPLPFTYLGKQTTGGQLEVYLAKGEDVIIVRDQTVIQNTYRVESIKPPMMSLVYLPLNEIQRLSIGATN